MTRQLTATAGAMNGPIPARGDRIEMRRSGVAFRGTVHYSDQLQILVKWDNGASSSLRVGRARFVVLETLDRHAVAG